MPMSSASTAQVVAEARALARKLRDLLSDDPIGGGRAAREGGTRNWPAVLKETAIADLAKFEELLIGIETREAKRERERGWELGGRKGDDADGEGEGGEEEEEDGDKGSRGAMSNKHASHVARKGATSTSIAASREGTTETTATTTRTTRGMSGKSDGHDKKGPRGRNAPKQAAGSKTTRAPAGDTRAAAREQGRRIIQDSDDDSDAEDEDGPRYGDGNNDDDDDDDDDDEDREEQQDTHNPTLLSRTSHPRDESINIQNITMERTPFPPLPPSIISSVTTTRDTATAASTSNINPSQRSAGLADLNALRHLLTSHLVKIAKARDLDSKSKTLRLPPGATTAKSILQAHIRGLTHYNATKDVAQQLIGLVAENRGVPVASLYSSLEEGKDGQGEFGVSARD